MRHLRMFGIAALVAVAGALLGGAGSASATTLEVGGAAQSKSVSIEATLKSGTSSITKDNNGTTNQTCTGSQIKFATEGSFTGGTVTGKASTWTWTGCSHVHSTLTPGSLSITWTSGTNGTVVSSGAEWTAKSTVFGVSYVCKTGTGTTIGTLTGVSSGNATIDINATTLDCGALGTSSWTGTYTVTIPSGLGVTA